MMVISTILFPVIAFGLAIGVGRIGTIIIRRVIASSIVPPVN